MLFAGCIINYYSCVVLSVALCCCCSSVVVVASFCAYERKIDRSPDMSRIRFRVLKLLVPIKGKHRDTLIILNNMVLVTKYDSNTTQVNSNSTSRVLRFCQAHFLSSQF